MYTTDNMIAYRDYFVRRMKRQSRVRFINATEGGILTEGVDILPLWEAFEQSLIYEPDVTAPLAAGHRPRKVSTEALEHLRQVLKYRRTDCDCLNGFLELTAKEHLLGKDTCGFSSRKRDCSSNFCGSRSSPGFNHAK